MLFICGQPVRHYSHYIIVLLKPEIEKKHENTHTHSDYSSWQHRHMLLTSWHVVFIPYDMPQALDAENTTALDSCIQIHKYAWNVLKVCNITNSATSNLNAINLELNSWRKDQNLGPRNYMERTNAITQYTSQ